VVAYHPPVASREEGDVDWRRIASGQRVARRCARVGERARSARSAAPHDLVQAERVFRQMLDGAAGANATHEPGRETLVDAKGPRDAASLGPGKVTRVLLEDRGGGAPGKQNNRDAPNAQGTRVRAQSSASVDNLHKDLVAAVQAGKNAVELLATSDPATIVAALGAVRSQDGSGVLQKILSVASGAIERISVRNSARKRKERRLRRLSRLLRRPRVADRPPTPHMHPPRLSRRPRPHRKLFARRPMPSRRRGLQPPRTSRPPPPPRPPRAGPRRRGRRQLLRHRRLQRQPRGLRRRASRARPPRPSQTPRRSASPPRPSQRTSRPHTVQFHHPRHRRRRLLPRRRHTP